MNQKIAFHTSYPTLEHVLQSAAEVDNLDNVRHINPGTGCQTLGTTAAFTKDLLRRPAQAFDHQASLG